LRGTASHASENAIAQFLLAHPDFLHARPELLEALELRHQGTTGAVSLIERQVVALRERNARLARELESLVATARESDAQHERLHRFAIAMLDAAGLDDVFSATREHLHEMFGAQAVAVRLYGFPTPGGPAEVIDSADRRLANLMANCLAPGTAAGGRPAIGVALDSAARAFLFGPDGASLRSFTLVALSVRDRRGVLALGSRTAHRLPADTTAAGLQRIGELLSAAATRFL
jgi:hypothetical protein